MTDKQLRKLNRAELLELLLEQSKEIDRLESELEETQAALRERNLKIENCGSIADAAAEVNSLFRIAQKTADMYLVNVQRLCAEKAEAAGKSEEWTERMKSMEETEGRVPVTAVQAQETEKLEKKSAAPAEERKKVE